MKGHGIVGTILEPEAIERAPAPFGLSRTLPAVPHSSRDVLDEDFPLIPASGQEWYGWVFVNASGDPIPFSEHASGLGDHLGTEAGSTALEAEV